MATLQKKSDSKRITASVIIPSFKRFNLALRLAIKIRKTQPEIEIIIVDQLNDNRVNHKHLEKNSIRYINLPRANLSEARNIGIKYASGEIVIFFDDDVEITRTTLPAHLAAYDDADVIAVAGRVINDDERLVKKTDVKAGKTDFLGLTFLSNFWSTKKQNIDFPYGCNMSFRKEALKQAGCFDENFPKIFDEIDMAVRLRKHGKCIFEPKALVYHHKAKAGGNREMEKQDKQSLIFINYGHYLAKNIFFPFSLISLLIRSVSAIKHSKKSLICLLSGYFSNIFFSVNFWTFVVLMTGLILRFINILGNFVFDIDTEYQALLAKTIVTDFHVIWIGVSAANIGYYLGPGLVYLSALLLKLSNLDPVVFGYFSSFVGLITLCSIYYVSEYLFGKKSALMAAFIYAISFLAVFYDRKFWPIFVPFISIWIFYSLIKSVKNPRWLIVSILLISVSYHIHLSLLVFWPFFVYFFLRSIRKIDLLTWGGCIFGYLIITLPLLVFDFVHNFDNLLMPVRFISKILKNGSLGLKTNFSYLILLTGKFFSPYYPLYVGFVTVIFCLLYILLSLKHQRTLAQKTLLVLLIYLVLVFGFYPGPVQEYYFVIFMPFIAVFTGTVLSKFRRIFTLFIILFFAGINLYGFFKYFNPSGLYAKKVFIEKVSSNVNDNYYLSYDSDRDYEGWRFLFEVYGKKPVQSKADQMFGWLYQQDITKEKPNLEVYISDIYSPPQTNAIQTITSGVFKAYFIRK